MLTVRFRWEDSDDAGWLCSRHPAGISFDRVSLCVARALHSNRFQLLSSSTREEVSLNTWESVVGRLRAKHSSVLQLVVRRVDEDDEPSSQTNFAQWVDPFWGCEKTSLPQTQGVAAAWYWPKALAGNTHPGATFPNGMVSVVPYSGAYPCGYGVNASSSRGMPSPLLDGHASAGTWTPCNQYTCTGFSHMQPSGTGAIGTYYNFLRAMPLRCGVDEFLSRCAGAGLDAHRCTLAAERAAPGLYSCVLCESNVAAEVTVGAGFAAHRYCFRSAWHISPDQLTIASSHDGAPPNSTSSTEGVSDVPSLASCSSPRTSDSSLACVVVELTAAGLASTPLRQRVRAISASVKAGGRKVEGHLITPPPCDSETRGSFEGVKLFFHMELGTVHQPPRSKVKESNSSSSRVKFSCAQMLQGALTSFLQDVYILVGSEHATAPSVFPSFKFWPPKFSSATCIELDDEQIQVEGGNIGVVAALDGVAVVELRVGLSLRSLEQARANVTSFPAPGIEGALSEHSFLTLNPPPTFDELAAYTWRTWNDTLQRVAVLDDASMPGMTQAKSLFYSTLYHALAKPADFTGQVPESWTEAIDGGAGNGGYFFDLSTMWDQYKTCLPLLLAVYPEVGSRLLQGLLALQARFGEFPNGYTMDDDVSRFDNQAVALAHHTLADGFYRGVSLGPACSWDQALEFMLDVFDSPEGIAFERDGRTEDAHITHTLDFAAAAFATSRIAYCTDSPRAISVRARLDRLASNWVNIFDSHTGLCLATGSYYEGTLWNYSFRLLPNMQERIQRFPARSEMRSQSEQSADGNSEDGKDASQFVKLLDSFFGFQSSPGAPSLAPAKPPICQLPVVSSASKQPWVDNISAAGLASHTFEGLCNEPDMETPFAYLYAGRADRLARVMHAMKSYSFALGRGGIPGNVDSGAEAAWYVWASVGIFPASGLPIYYIGMPSFQQVRLRLGSNGRSLLIKRSGMGMFINKGSLNRKPLKGRAWLWVSEAEAGGTLQLEMCTRPCKEWGSEPPPSWSEGRPHRDEGLNEDQEPAIFQCGAYDYSKPIECS